MIAKYGLPEQVQFCTRCVMSNQRPNSRVEYAHKPDAPHTTIGFTDGICDACRVAEQKQSTDWQAREQELLQLLDQHRSRTGAHDVIVPGSGGKDSFFAAHVLKEKYGMHPLTVTWAPHLYTEWGRRNHDRFCAVADNILYTPNMRVHALLTRLAVNTLLHPFQPFIIGQKSIAARMAEKYNIPLIFYGENEAEYGNPIADSASPKRAAAYHQGSGSAYLSGVPVDVLKCRHGLTDADLAAYLPLQSQADVRYLGYYLKWHPQSMYYYAVEHGGFEAAPERTPGTYSKYNSIDDKLDDLHYYTTWIKFGLGRASYDAAQEIRSGDITRDEAVLLVRKFEGEYPTRFEQEVFRYLSVPGFPEMTRDYFLALCDRFQSPHLWGSGPNGSMILRHVVT